MRKIERPAELPVERIARSIRYLRGQRAILDSDLAAIYEVTTGRFSESVKPSTSCSPCCLGKRNSGSWWRNTHCRNTRRRPPIVEATLLASRCVWQRTRYGHFLHECPRRAH